MKKASSLSMVFTLCALIVASLSASAQSTFTWNGSTSGNWTNTTSWIPEAPFGGPTGNGTIVIFNNPTAANCDVSLLGANPTVGSLTVNSSLGTAVRFGNSTDSSSGGVLTLASDSTPVLNVSGNSSLRLAIFAELSGTQGFTKTGNGTLNFNTNTLDMNNLSGTVTLQDGTVWINQAGNLGTGNLSFTGNSTLQMRGNFTTTFGANRSVTIASGVTATLSNYGSSSAIVLQGPLTGYGNVAFNAGSFTLNGSNTLTGNTSITSGTVTLGQNCTLSSPALTMTSGTLNLGNNTQTLSSLATTVGGTGELMITQGSLVINSATDQTIGGRANGANITFSGLNAFTFNGSSSNFTFQAGSVNATNQNGLILSTNGTNTFTANVLMFGNAPTSTGTNNATVQLGKTNTIYSETFIVGYSGSNGSGASGAISFQAASSNATLKIRSSNGIAALPNWIIGQTESSSHSGQGSVNLSNGTLDAIVTNLTIGKHNTTGAVADTSSLTISSGSLTAESIILGEKIGDGSPALTSTITQTGGEVIAKNLTFGKGGNSTSAQFLPTYNLTGGTLYAETISVGTGISNNATSSRNINIANGTLRNYSGSNLTITGLDSTTGGRINITINGTSTLEADAGKTITLGADTVLAGSGNFSKNGTGDLLLSSALSQTYSGTATINAGRFLVYSNNMTSATIDINGGTFTGNTTVSGIKVTTNTLFDIAANQRITANSSFSGSGNFSKNGTGELAIGSGQTQTYNGTATLNTGRLSLNSNMPAATLIINGGTIGGNSTFGPVTLNGNATFDVSANQTLTANSTFGGSANFSKTGTGTLTITNGLAYTGSATVSAGNLSISSVMSSATIDMAGGTLSGNSVIGPVIVSANSTFNIAAAQTLTANSTFGGSSNFSKTGAGTLTITNGLAYTGNATVSAGNLTIRSDMPAASLIMAGGTLSGNSVFGSLSVSANSTFDVSASQVLTANSTFGGSGNFTKSGTGELAIGNGQPQTYNGTVTLNAGRLSLTSNVPTAKMVLNGGTLGGNATFGSVTLSANSIFDVSANQTLTANSTFAGSGGFSKNGTGELAIGSGQTQTYNGTATLNAGRLSLNSNMPAATLIINGGTLGGNSTLGPITVSGNAIFDVSASQTLTANSTFGGSANFSKTGTGTLTIINGLAYTGTATVSAGNLSISTGLSSASIDMAGGTLSGNSAIGPVTLSSNSTFNIAAAQTLTTNSTFGGNANFSKTGTGTLTITNGLAYTGTATVSAGNLTIRSDMTSGTLILAGGSLGGNGTIGSVNVTANSTFNVGTGDRLVLGTSATLAGSSNLTKTGNGTLAVGCSGIQPFTGSTIISAGSLIVNSNMAAAGTTTVNATGALLGGNGTLGSVSLVKGTLGPGDGSLSTLNTGSLTWSAVATMTFDLSSNSTLSDKILLNGNFTKSGTGNFTFNFIGGQASTTYTLVSWSGNTTFTAGNFTASGQTGSFAIAAKELQFTVIPEPSVVFLFLGGVAALIALHFNRKQKSPFTPDHTARSDDPGRSSSKPNKGSGLRITETCKKKENPPWRGSAL